MWTCPSCAEENDDNAPYCAVCATRPHFAGSRARPPVSPYPRPAGPAYPTAADPWAPAAEPFTPPPPTPPAPVPQPAAPEPVSYSGDPGPPRRPLPTRWILAVALVFLVGVGVATAIAVPRLFSARDDTRSSGTTPAPGPTAGPATETADPAGTETADPAGTDTTDPVTEDPTPTEATATPPASSGIVVIDPSIAGDDRAAAVATMFDTYFGGVNDKNYNAVGSVLDPAGSVNPDNRQEMADLARGTRSTTDSAATLTALSGAGRLLTAEVTFRSAQDPGDGPRGRTAETCTRWDIRYTLSGAPDAYRIRKSKANSAPC